MQSQALAPAEGRQRLWVAPPPPRLDDRRHLAGGREQRSPADGVQGPLLLRLLLLRRGGLGGLQHGPAAIRG